MQWYKGIVFVFLVLLLCNGYIHAQGPILKPLPDVFISDIEDFSGTVDLNMFRFSDAFSLDRYVFVPEGVPDVTELIWSFIESNDNNDVEINGITQLDSPENAVYAAFLGKDIRHAAAPFDDSFVDFWDLLDSPRGAGPPFQGGDPSYVPQLNKIITFFVSDGVFVDSGQFVVKANSQGGDFSEEWIHRRVDDFEGNTDGWNFRGPSANAPDARFSGAFSGTTPGAITIRTDDVTNRFGFWSGPPATFCPDELYRLTWTLTTDQTDQERVPSIRLRVDNKKWSHEMTLSTPGSYNPNAPTQTGKEYNQYFMLHSELQEEMNPSFDVYDFSNPGDIGTVRLEELKIDSRQIPDDGWISKSVPPFGAWKCVNGPGVYYNVSSGILSGLRLSSTLYNSFHYGFWGTGGNGALKFEPTDKIYRAIFTVRTADTNSPWCMLRMNSQDQQVAHRFTVYTPAQSDPDGNHYTLYFTRHTIAPGYDGFDLFFELADFVYTQAGALTLSKVQVEHYDLSFYP